MALRDNGPFEQHIGVVLKVDKKCKRPRGVSFNMEVLIRNEVFVSKNTHIGGYPAPGCFFGKVVMFPLKLNDLQLGDTVEVLMDKNRNIYLGRYTNLQHLLHIFASITVLLVLYILNKHLDRRAFEDKIRGASN